MSPFSTWTSLTTLIEANPSETSRPLCWNPTVLLAAPGIWESAFRSVGGATLHHYIRVTDLDLWRIQLERQGQHKMLLLRWSHHFSWWLSCDSCWGQNFTSNYSVCQSALIGFLLWSLSILVGFHDLQLCVFARPLYSKWPSVWGNTSYYLPNRVQCLWHHTLASCRHNPMLWDYCSRI